MNEIFIISFLSLVVTLAIRAGVKRAEEALEKENKKRELRDNKDY